MARRVNTRFVVLLGSGLLLAAGVLVAYLGQKYLANHDPAHLMKLAAETEDKALHGPGKPGDPDRLKELILARIYYNRAADESSKRHKEGTEEMYMKVADLGMQLSALANNSTEARTYYEQAKAGWTRALTENTRYLPAHEKLIEEVYKTASAYGALVLWTSLEDRAQKLTVLDPKYGHAFTYLAAARLEMLQAASSTALDSVRVTAVDADIQRAMEKDPASAIPPVLRSRLLYLRVRHLSPGMEKEAKKLLQSAIDELQAFLAKHPHDPDVTIQLFSALLANNQETEAVKALEDAVAADPHHVRVASSLAWAYFTNHLPEKGEKVLKNLVAVAGDDPDAHQALAHYYRDENMFKESIEEFKKVLEHPQPGGGIVAAQNIGREVDSLFGICWAYMDVADRAGVATPDGKEAMANAVTFADRLRASASPREWQDLVDGRLLLVKGATREAVVYLRRADVNLSKGNPGSVQWRDAKSVLSYAYQQLSEWGNALSYLDQLQQQFPQYVEFRLRKAQLYNRVARWQEAINLVDPVANPRADLEIPAELQRMALNIEAEAYRGMGVPEKYQELMNKIPGPDAKLKVIWSLLADGDKEGALSMMRKAVDESPDHENTRVTAVIINMLADKKNEAKELLDGKDGLAKKFPNNKAVPVLQALLNAPEGDPLQTQLAAIDAIADPLTRHLNKAQLYRQAGDHDKQLAELEAALEVKDASATTEFTNQLNEQIFSLALGLAEQAGTLAQQAQSNADATHDADKKAKFLSEKSAQDQRSAKYRDQAELYVQKAERMKLDGADGKLYRGRFEFSKGGDSRRLGLQILEQVVQARPYDSMSHTVLGQAYYMMDGGHLGSMSDKALEEFRQAIKEKPDNASALRLAIDLLIKKGDPQSIVEGEGFLKQALAFAPRDPLLRDYSDVLGDPTEAIRQREETAKTSPDNIENLSRLATLYVKHKEPEKAIKLLSALYAKNKDNFALADRLAQLYREANMKNEALSIYEHFIASDDPEMSFYATLKFGDMYKSFGDTVAAGTTYESAVAKQPPGNDDAQRRLADLLFELYHMPEAEALYRKIYEDKKDLPVLRRLVECLVQQEKFADADVLINTLLARQPDDPDALILRGVALFKQNKTADAIACFSRVIAAHPDNLDALHYRAFIQWSTNGDLEQAIKDLRAVRERAPNHANSRLLLAKVFALSRHFSEACDEYEAVIDLRPDSLENRIEYGRMLLTIARVFARLSPENTDEFAMNIRAVKPIDRLQALLVKSAERFPEEPQWLVFAGDLQMLSGYPAQAQQKYAEAFRKSNGNLQIASTFLSSLIETQKYADVINFATQLVNVQPKESEYFAKRMVAYAATGKIPEALADFDQALGLMGNDIAKVIALVTQAETSIKSDALPADLRARVQEHPKDATWRIALAHVLLMRGDDAGVLAAFAPLDASARSENRALLLRITAMARYQSKDFPGAYKDYKEILDLAPNDLEVLNNMAYLIAEDMKKPKDALPFAQKAVDLMRAGKVDILFTDNGNVYDTLGWVKFLAGDINGAVTELKTSLNVEASVVAYFHLAKALQKNHDTLGACQAVTAGIRLAKARNDPMLSQLEALATELGCK